MRKVLWSALAVVAVVGCATTHPGRKHEARKERRARPAVSVGDAYRIAGRFKAVSAFRSWLDGDVRLAVGTHGGYLHIIDFGPGGPRLEWQSPNLGSPVRGVLVRDFQGDGRAEIAVYTAGGRLMILDMRSYTVVRESPAFDLPEISYVAAAQLDKDPALELLACGGGKFAVYDGATLFKEWEAPGDVPGEWLAVGDVDGDGQLEVVLNSGYVLDAKFFRIENTLGKLGERVETLDLDGDGVDEIVAEREDGSVSVFDSRMPGVPEY